jgi:Zn/Cd-binding protein ZinT
MTYYNGSYYSFYARLKKIILGDEMETKIREKINQKINQKINNYKSSKYSILSKKSRHHHLKWGLC